MVLQSPSPSLHYHKPQDELFVSKINVIHTAITAIQVAMIEAIQMAIKVITLGNQCNTEDTDVINMGSPLLPS